MEFFESRRIPFLVAANHFEGAHPYREEDIHLALHLHPQAPVRTFDARDRIAAHLALIALVTHALDRAPSALA